jgi:hypothetical protein
MRVSGKGREHLLVLIPLGVVLAYAIIVNGGPGPFLTYVDRRLEDVFAVIAGWVKDVL